MSAPGLVPTRALFINGTVGAGKTTTAHEIGTLLQDRGTPYAIIDLDSLRNAWPSPPDDRFNLEPELQNLAAILEAAQVDDLVVTVDDEPPDVIAAQVLADVGWI